MTNVLKDYKSARGGVVLFFNVSNSSLDYQYNYSLEEDNWMRGYDLDGYRITSEKIIYDEEK